VRGRVIRASKGGRGGSLALWGASGISWATTSDLSGWGKGFQKVRPCARNSSSAYRQTVKSAAMMRLDALTGICRWSREKAAGDAGPLGSGDGKGGTMDCSAVFRQRPQV